MTKTIICLANSRKLAARCIAGKEVESQRWIRPVTGRASHEISRYQCRYRDGKDPQVLDIIRIPIIELVPHAHQPENVLIDVNESWEKVGRITCSELVSLVDAGPLPWASHSTYGKVNDRVPEPLLNPAQGSLRLIYVDKITLRVETKILYASSIEKKVIRAVFQHHGTPYALDLTDPVVESHYLRKEHGEYTFPPAYLCVSLGEIYHGFAYKLVSSIITEEPLP